MAVRTSSIEDSTVGSLSETSGGPEHTRERLATYNETTKTLIPSSTAGLGGTVNHERNDTHPLDDVQQAAKVMRVAALGEVHQQLGGLFPDSRVAVFSDAAQLGDDHHFNQLILEQDKGETQELKFNLQTCKLHQCLEETKEMETYY